MGKNCVKDSIMSKSALECMNGIKKNYIEGYNITFTKSVILCIWLKRSKDFGEGYIGFKMPEPEREEEETDQENQEEEEEEEERINTNKIFKSDECIICLTNSPNILFCT